MSTITHHRETSCLAVPVTEVARMLGISVRHVWALVADGHLPRPIHLGRAARWSVDELRACIASRALEPTQKETAE